MNFLDSALEKTAGAITRAERQIGLMREYRTRLIADVITGQVDVREAVHGLPDSIEQTGELAVTDEPHTTNAQTEEELVSEDGAA